jgi:hypothetical protein
MATVSHLYVSACAIDAIDIVTKAADNSALSGFNFKISSVQTIFLLFRTISGPKSDAPGRRWPTALKLNGSKFRSGQQHQERSCKANRDGEINA